MEPWGVVFYRNADGESPALEVLRALTPLQRRAVGRTIRLLQDNGTNLAAPHCRFLGKGLWELKAQVEGHAFRCLYVVWTGRRFLILHAFQKKTQKTPPQEIDIARRRWADWEGRNKEA